MKILYVSDLDGTLLNTGSSISASTIHTINTLIDQGMHFTYATARSFSSSHKLCAKLNLQEPLIVYNGIHIVDPHHGEMLYAHPFQEREAVSILDFLIDHQIYPFVYAYIDGRERVSYLQKDMQEGALHYLAKRQGDQRFRVVHDVRALFEGDIFYITCIHDKEVLNSLYVTLEEETPFSITFQPVRHRHEYCLEITPTNCSKACALQELKALGQYDQIICFGDAQNDAAMFEICDEAYAMSNAIDEIKARATKVIGSNDEDGVANWLKAHYLGEE